MMAAPPNESDVKRVVVQISTQQHPVIERVCSAGCMGATDGEVLRSVFLDWVTKKITRVEPVSTIGIERDTSTQVNRKEN